MNANWSNTVCHFYQNIEYFVSPSIRVPTTENSEARTAVLLCSSLVTTLGKVKIVSLPVTKRCYQYCSTVLTAYIGLKR